MCDYCDGVYDEEEIVSQIRNDVVPHEVFFCDSGWEEASRIWGRYGSWGRKEITTREWQWVCKSRADARAGL